MGLAFVLALIASFWMVREPVQRLTPDALDEAKARWRSAGIEDYDLSYDMNGTRYEVQVRDGIVVDLEVAGRPARSVDWGLYSVEGLFDLLAMELENLSDPRGPFASQGKVITARVRFHPELGYVERFLRSAGPGGKPASIRLISFTSISAATTDP